jgi:hypothetical protein
MAKSRQAKTAKKTSKKRAKPRQQVRRETRPERRATRRVPAAQGKAAIPAEVGYGRPPVEHQFRPGESGNPAGTPPARCNLWRHLCRYLELPEEEIRAAAKDRRLPANQRIAAKQAAQLIQKGFTGVALQATMRMWDRDEGRPTARIVMETADVLTPEECEEIRQQQRRQLEQGGK